MTASDSIVSQLPGNNSAAQLWARAEKVLQQIYGDDAVWDWRENGTPLADVRVDEPGTVIFESNLAGFAAGIKEGRRIVNVKLVAPRRGFPADAALDIDAAALVTVKLIPIAQQLSLGMGSSSDVIDASERGVPAERGVSDRILEVRLLSIAPRGKALPDGWRERDQDWKDAAARWALGITLQNAGSEVEMPPAPDGLEVWWVQADEPAPAPAKKASRKGKAKTAEERLQPVASGSNGTAENLPAEDE